MLTLFYLIWIGVLWLLHSRGMTRLAAATALALGGVPRTYLALAQWPSAWMLGAVGYVQLIAFGSLTVLWLVYLAYAALGRSMPKLVVPMLILAAVEVLSPATKIAQRTISVRIAAQLVFCCAQFAFLRGKMRELDAAPPQWGRL